jgi:response regulator RpfG family c-di-GMP phosphodiesterase
LHGGKLYSVHPEIQDLQVKLKEILYDCTVEIKATKAALYLLDTPTNRYELVTEYGFKGAARSSADEKNPIVDRCEKTRSPFFINGLMAEPRFSELMYEAQTDRLLVAPIYIRGQLVGIVDMRDKGGKAPFETADLGRAQSVGERIAELFASKNVWGQRFITLSDQSPLPPAMPASAPRMATPRPNSVPLPTPVAAPAEEATRSFVPKISSLILEARTATERLGSTGVADALSETELNIVREILRAVLVIPGAAVAAFSALGHLGGIQEIAARAPLHDDAIALMQGKLNSWLAKRGEGAVTLRNRVHTPFGTSGASIREQDVRKIFTAPIAAGSVPDLYLTVGFSAEPERSTHELLAAFHQQLQLAIEQSISRRQANAKRLRIAEKVIEPDFSRFPELRRHSNAVVNRMDAFARFLGQTQGEIDTARIVALVHDCGMRLLDYDRIYRKFDLPPDDLSVLREHTVVGAAIVDPLLGPEIARAVLCHHERWDGRGYPNGLSGEEIPLTSRILQICDVYEAMTGVDNYQTPLSHDSAMSVIAEGAEVQFDPVLTRRFEEMMRSAPQA